MLTSKYIINAKFSETSMCVYIYIYILNFYIFIIYYYFDPIYVHFYQCKSTLISVLMLPIIL